MQLPLQGIRIVDLSAVVSGPMAAGILADQGADVIKIEAPKGDLTRVIGPSTGDLSALFTCINRGKRSIVLDLKHPDGAAVLRDLVAQADVLVENFRPGAMDRLGFSYAAMSALNPRLVYLSIAGFGHTGPYSGFRVYDPVIQAVSGFADAHPNPETGEPQLLQTLLCDKITALTAAQSITAALHARGQSGQGQKIAVVHNPCPKAGFGLCRPGRKGNVAAHQGALRKTVQGSCVRRSRPGRIRRQDYPGS